MGGFFSAPKPPKPPPLPPTPVLSDNDQAAQTEDRLRRQKASGRQKNIVSSLSEQVSDSQSNTRISKLLG